MNCIAIDVRGLIHHEPTGVGTYTHLLVEKYLNQADDVVLWYSGWQRVEWIHTRWGSRATVLHIRMPNKLLNALLIFFKIPKLDKYIAKKIDKPINVMIAPNMNVYALSPDITFVLTIHDLAFILFPWYYSWKGKLWHRFIYIQRLARRASNIVVPSQSTAWDVEDWLYIDSSNIQITAPTLPAMYQHSTHWNTARQHSVMEAYQLPSRYFLYLGTIEPRKNIETLLAAYNECKKTYAGIVLVIAGPRGWKCRKLMKDILSTSGVQYLGYVDDADKPALYAGAIAFVYPSFYEGYGFPVLEAQAVGTRVITSNRSSLLEVADERAILIDPYNVTDLAQAMMECCR